MRAISMVLLCTLALSGCYSYLPVRSGTTPGNRARVRLHLTQPQDVRLPDVTANGVTTIDGEVVRIDDENVVVSGLWVQAPSGYEQPASGATITVPRANVAAMRQKRLSPARTALLAVGTVLVMSVFTYAATIGSGRNGGTGRQPL